jgi:hypothetical protein
VHECTKAVSFLEGGQGEGIFISNIGKLVCDVGAGGRCVADSSTDGGGCVLTSVYNPPRNVQSVGSCTTSVAKSAESGLLA